MNRFIFAGDWLAPIWSHIRFPPPSQSSSLNSVKVNMELVSPPIARAMPTGPIPRSLHSSDEPSWPREPLAGNY